MKLRSGKEEFSLVLEEGDVMHDYLMKLDINWHFFNKGLLPSRIILEYDIVEDEDEDVEDGDEDVAREGYCYGIEVIK